MDLNKKISIKVNKLDGFKIKPLNSLFKKAIKENILRIEGNKVIIEQNKPFRRYLEFNSEKFIINDRKLNKFEEIANKLEAIV